MIGSEPVSCSAAQLHVLYPKPANPIRASGFRVWIRSEFEITHRFKGVSKGHTIFPGKQGIFGLVRRLLSGLTRKMCAPLSTARFN